MASHFVYIVRCADGTLYTGWTTDINNRLRDHNSGSGAKYTRSRLPVELSYYERYDDKSTPLKRECAIKKSSRTQTLDLISKPPSE